MVQSEIVEAVVIVLDTAIGGTGGTGGTAGKDEDLAPLLSAACIIDGLACKSLPFEAPDALLAIAEVGKFMSPDVGAACSSRHGELNTFLGLSAGMPPSFGDAGMSSTKAHSHAA
mmetsp:Transcript_28599/g.68020  ORF Transcript_28599/g.68020 Transcript_28599/m.68020 type:complete len:115 (-) Transcript_28599:8-352(-)